MGTTSAVTFAELEVIAKEANGAETNINGVCRAFCAMLISDIEHESPAYAASIAGLLHMSHTLETEGERAA